MKKLEKIGAEPLRAAYPHPNGMSIGETIAVSLAGEYNRRLSQNGGRIDDLSKMITKRP